ncbi:MAG: CopD family protein, partial [Dehalococcoidia bacterium]
MAHLLVQSQSSGLGVGSVLADTTWGRAWLIRVALASVAVALFALLRRGRPAWARHAAGRPAAMLAAAAAIAAVSLSSHAAATRGVEVVATLVDATHILAAAVWGGGLVAFLVLLLGVRRRREARSVLRVAVPRFSVLGIVATAALAVTGTYSAWLQVVTWRALDTPYGVGVLVKVAALVLLLALAAVNLVWVRRRLEHADSGAPATRWLGRIMRAEVAGIIVAVVAAGTIASLEPARQSVVRQEAEAGQRSTGEDADLSITLAVSPGGVGSNELTALLERGGDAYDGATGVMATLSYLDRELGTQEVPLARDAGEEGAWAAPLVLSVAGEYQVSVLVQRDDGFDARHAFRFQAGGTGAGGAVVEASPRRAWWLGVG